MKKLLLLIPALLILSCNKDCQEEQDSINAEYINALHNALTPAAIEQLKQQRDHKLSQLNC